MAENDDQKPDDQKPDDKVVTADDLMKQLGDMQSKVAEYQTQNVGLNKRLEAAQAAAKQWEGLDPEKYKVALGALEKLENQEERKLLEDGKIDDVVARRMAAMREDYETQLTALTKARKDVASERDTMKDKLGELLIDRDVQVNIGELGVKVLPGALDDILARARKIWRITETGDMLAMQGENKVFGKEGQPLKMTEWAATLVDKAKHLFERSSGGGAGGGAGDQPVPPASDFRNSLADIAAGKKRYEMGNTE